MSLAETRTAAEKAIATEKWSEAASLWETVYQAEQTADNNYQLVTALVADEQFLAASTTAAEFEQTYLETDQAADLYLTALLKSHQFIPAHILLNARQVGPWTHSAQDRIQAAENQAEQTMATTLDTTMRQFYHLSDQPVGAQTERLQAAKHLTYGKYLTAAKFLLVDPFLHQLSRVEVLYTLRAMGVPDEVTMQTFDEQRVTVVPATLPAMGKDATSLAVQQVLTEMIGQDDPTLYAGLQALLSLQLMFLYPQIERVILDAEVWVKVFVGLQTGQLSENNNPQTSRIVAVQQKIQQMIQDLQK